MTIMETSREQKGIEYVTCVTNSPDNRRAAVCYVAAHAADAEDCALLLDMLGLAAEEAR